MLGYSVNIAEEILLVWATITLFTSWFDWSWGSIFEIDIFFRSLALAILLILSFRYETNQLNKRINERKEKERLEVVKDGTKI